MVGQITGFPNRGVRNRHNFIGGRKQRRYTCSTIIKIHAIKIHVLHARRDPSI